jgi:hypothetical protein
VTGASRGISTGADYATVAYNAGNGVRRWVARYNGPGNGTDTAHAVIAGPGGRTVYVTGGSTGATSGSDYATVAYNAVTGARRWVGRYDGPVTGVDTAHSIAVSRDGRGVYVTGYSASVPFSRGTHVATIGYAAANGAQRWAKRFRSGARCHTYGTSVATGLGASRVFVTGYSTPGTQCPSGYATLAYSAANGALLWANHNSPASSAAYSIAVSPDGSAVFITGQSFRPSSTDDFATAGYKS